MKTIPVNDYANKMVALTIDVPDHWESASSINWYCQGTIGVNIEIKVFAPNGPDMFWLRPPQKFESALIPFIGLTPGSVPLMDASSAIHNFIVPEYQRQYTGLRLVAIENMPVPQARRPELEQSEMMLKMVNPNARLVYDSATAFFEYNQKGMAISESVSAVCEGIESQDLFTGGGFANWTLAISSYKSNRKTNREMISEADALLATLKLNPQWQKYRDDIINQSQRQHSAAQSQQANHNNDMWKSQMEHQNRMFKMQQDTFNETNRSMQNTFNQTRKSMSDVSGTWTDTLRGYREVYDPYNNRHVDVNNNYNYTWMDKYGNIIQTDKSYYDPNRDEGGYGDWRQV